MVMTFLVLKWFKSNSLRDEQPENIFFIFTTLLVSKFLIFSIDNEEHPLNIPSKLVTWGVIKLAKFNEVIKTHPENI